MVHPTVSNYRVEFVKWYTGKQAGEASRYPAIVTLDNPGKYVKNVCSDTCTLIDWMKLCHKAEITSLRVLTEKLPNFVSDLGAFACSVGCCPSPKSCSCTQWQDLSYRPWTTSLTNFSPAGTSILRFLPSLFWPTSSPHSFLVPKRIHTLSSYPVKPLHPQSGSRASRQFIALWKFHMDIRSERDLTSRTKELRSGLPVETET